MPEQFAKRRYHIGKAKMFFLESDLCASWKEPSSSSGTKNISDKFNEAKGTTKQAIQKSTEVTLEAEQLKDTFDKLRQKREQILAEVTRAHAGEEKARAQVTKADK